MTNLKLDVHTAEGGVNGSVELPASVFDAEVSIALMHQVVVAQRAAARQGTHKVKTRGEVRGGGRKPWRLGGIWVDYELMTSIKGLFAIGECNFSDHGANRLGASALMQGLADGYFVLPYTIQNYLADQITVPRFSTDLPEFAAAEKAIQDKIDWMMNIKGKKSVDSIHKELGHVMWEYVGMGRTAEGLKEGLKRLKEIRKEFEKELFIPGEKEGMNVELDKAIRLYDFITMGELVAYDALNRNESCGGHFREEYQTEEGEAKRDDENYFYVACWEYQGSDEKEPVLLKEPLVYEAIKVQTRNYKS